MTGAETLDVARDAIFVFLQVASPIMIATLIVGLAIALLQALTQVQEMTLVFVPKILVIFLLLLAMLPFMSSKLNMLMLGLMDRVAA
ncbi:MAG: flagellar biosynthetic protein FliQ [Pseudomonadota bacterium]